MPLILDDPASFVAAAPTTTGPRFFSSKLTGDGRTRRGLLSADLGVDGIVSTQAYADDVVHSFLEIRSSVTQSSITTTTMPFAPLASRWLQVTGASLAMPDSGHRFEVNVADPDWCVFLALTPQGACMFEDTTRGPRKRPRQFVIGWRMELFFVRRGIPEPDRVRIGVGRDAWAEVRMSVDPLTDAADFIRGTGKVPGAAQRRITAGWTDETALSDWLDDFNVYDAIAACARVWDSTDIADETIALVDHLVAGHGTAGFLGSTAMAALENQLHYLENYNIPLEAYRTINAHLEKTFSDDVTAVLARQNLNLLMSHALSNLDRKRGGLTTIPAPGPNVTVPSRLSAQQQAAVTTREPLALVQAGAGTGKSSVILARIDHMAACGVDPSDITVLSFTNAAADHICEKNPGVGSMTIAAMINDIYRLNHPTHEISSVPTIRNSLDIYFPGSDLAARLKRHLLDLENKEVGAATELNNFVEAHFDDVMALLDGIGQTSLELDIIICYQRIDSMAEPPQAACHHLIIDEVQDTSIFEFVYLLKFAAKHSTSLFMVGDASQTLYEFRAANPRALNTLEASGVFATYRLTTNYRSNQEILDFANVALGGLETNRFAGIQLRANSLAAPTAASFTQKVTLDHRFTPQTYKFIGKELAGIIASTVARDYIDPALDRGEKVAFLAYSRREVDAVEAALEQRYPGRTIANLVSERPFDTTIFSNYVKMLWNDVLMVQPADAAFTMTQDIMSNLDRLSRGRISPAAEKAMRALVSQWWIQNAAAVNGWVKLVAAGRITAREFFARLRSNVLDFEIRHNSVHQNMVNQRNRERKERKQNADAQLIVSTIHGVKGLEFDNVVVIHRDSPDMSQEMRRLFYVAFTRAAGTEYVLSYGSQKDSPIVSDYELVVDTLEKAEARAAIIAAGGNQDAPDPDDAPVGASAA